MNFENKNILIIGISSDLGNTLANILTNLKANVIGTYYNHKTINNFKLIQCNITDEKDVKKLFNEVINKYHKIDAIINCAALSLDNEFKNKSFDEFMKVVATNLGGTFLINKYAALNMDKGTIINISSDEGLDKYTSLSMDYASSKAGVNNLTRNFAKTCPNLKICALAPAWINTKTVLQMDSHYLKKVMQDSNQIELLKKENVALKIIEILINDDDYISGDIILMENDYE